MNPLPAILLICNRDPLFREALRNFLLASGYREVAVAASVRDALTRLRRERYGYVVIGTLQPFSRGRRLAFIARQRQPEAKIFCLVSAQDQPSPRVAPCEYVVKEHVFSNLLGLM
jgi:DNA-binding NarL/FixJ family response regulator